MLQKLGRIGLIPYITAGFPDYTATRDFLAGAADAGADFVELGVPWSDPVADGPVIQASSHAALKRGATMHRTLAVLRETRGPLPVVLFTYLNPVLAMGASALAREAAGAGAAALLVVDLPAGSDPAVERDLRSSGLPLIRLVAPNTGQARLREIAAVSEGFVYVIARTGVTGAPTELGDEIGKQLEQVTLATGLPVALGFGIATDEQASMAAQMAAGVVVGSAIVRALGEGGAPLALERVRAFRRAIDRAEPPV